MPFEDVMGTVMSWATATQALAALGGQLALAQSGEPVPPEIDAALRGVTAATGLTDLDSLAPQQRSIALGVISLYLRQAVDLLDEPGRPPGWSYTDPEILDGWGRGSAMVPSLIAGAHADLASVHSLLDVGTGVGLLAVAATAVWPDVTVVGLDRWAPSLDRARANVERAGVTDRVTLRRQELVELDDVDAYDCVWVPTFFLTEPVLEQSLPQILRALHPGGWAALGRVRSSPDPLARAVETLTTVRGGGFELTAERAGKLLEAAGYARVHTSTPQGPAPLELTLGQRPA
jgi:hypothetical protein